MSLNNLTDPFAGKRYVALVRASNDTDGTTSTDAQLEWMHSEGTRLGMQLVHDEILSGVTGSLPGRREDLQRLLRRRAEQRDFDVLLVQRCDRLSRSGAPHMLWFIHEANKVGLIVHFAGDDIPADSPFRNTILSMKADAAQEQAKAISQRSVQGWMYAINQGINCPISRTPFGCDRLYLASDGRPLFVIRNLGDGRQHKLHPETGELLDTYGRVGGGNRGHYDKQKDERVLIISGEPGAAETVRLTFDLHYNQRLGGKRIADVLNQRGLRSPTGIEWSQRQAESIYENPIYCGVARGRVASQGIYFRQGEQKPEEVRLDAEILTNCWTAPRQLRPPEDWRWVQQPLMTDFLPADLSAKALPQIKALMRARWERSQDPTRARRSSSKHKNSEYVLTGLLVAAQDGEALSGVLCGKVGKKVRKYRHPRSARGYRKGSIFNNYIRAAELEDAVLEQIGEIMANSAALRDLVLAAIRASAPDGDTAQRLSVLRTEREKVAQRTRLISRMFTEEHLADVQPELDALAAQRRELDRQINEMEKRSAFAAEDPNELVDRVLAQVTNSAVPVGEISASMKRELLEEYVDRVVVDMATKDAEVYFKLPESVLAAEFGVRLGHNSRSQTERDTPHHVVIRIGITDCKYQRLPREVCYVCRRRAA
jgi:DNA invertase Pin-like site-specific DNA recombinase/AcrR family transcriptional regulator